MNANRMLTWRWLRWVPVLIPVLPIAYCKSIEQLNKHDVCVPEMRRIPDEELIQRSIAFAIKRFPPPDKKLVRDSTGNWISALEGYGEPIAYKSVNEFLEVNPDCCKVDKSSMVSGYTPSEDERSFGSGRAYVLVTYKLRYKTKDGQVAFRMHRDESSFNNCGELWRSW